MTQADPQGSFRADLDELAQVAATHMPRLVELLEQQVTVLNQFEGISQPTMYCNADVAFYAFNGAIRDRAKQAVTSVAASAEALHGSCQVK